jgi:hypothetical protein
MIAQQLSSSGQHFLACLCSNVGKPLFVADRLQQSLPQNLGNAAKPDLDRSSIDHRPRTATSKDERITDQEMG